MQHITTAAPDDAIIGVAIEAMNAALTGKVPEKEQPAEGGEAESDE